MGPRSIAAKETGKSPAPGRLSPEKCRLFMQMSRTAGSAERAYALAALAECAPAPEVTEVLRRAVLLDDYRARARALDALGAHLRPELVRFLTALLYGPSTAAGMAEKEHERVLLYDYLERLAEPKHRELLVPVFRRGLYGSEDRHARGSVLEFLGRHGYSPERFAREKRLLISSLRGLGRLRAREEWPRMRDFMTPGITDPDILTAALQGAGLLPFEKGEADRVARNTSRLLFHGDARVRGAAISFFAGLPSIVATESLMVMYVKLNPADHRELLEESIRKRLRLDGTGGRAGITLIRARLHDMPAERGTIAGVLDEYTVIYRDRTSAPGHRLRPVKGRAGPEANWHFVRTSSGLRGWLHAHRTLYPNLDIAKKAPAAGKTPAAGKRPAAK